MAFTIDDLPSLKQTAENGYAPDSQAGSTPIKTQPNPIISTPVQESKDPLADIRARVNTPATGDKYEPEHFNWDESGAQKYVNSPHYNTLGYDTNIGDKVEENVYANAQTGWEETKQMAKGWGDGLVQGFVQQAKSIGNFAKIFTDPTLANQFTQDQLEEINKREKNFDNNYHIFQGDDPTIWSKVAKGIQSTGNLIGSVGELFAETWAANAAIVASFGALGTLEGVESARWAALGKTLQANELAKKAVNAGINADKAINNSSVIGKTWAKIGEAASNASKILPTVGNTVGYAGDLGAYGAEGGTLATIGRGIGAVTNDIRQINLATSFASGNAAGTYQQLISDQIQDYKRDHGGRLPEGGEMDEIKDKALKGAKTDGAINAWAMLMMEKVSFGNILNNRRTLQEALQKSGSDVFDRVAIKPSWAEGAESEPLYVKQQAKWYDMKANYKALPREIGMGAVTHGIGFGATMNVMEGIDKGIKSYYDAKYDNRDVDGFDAIRDGINSQFTKEGAETFISGFLNGALVMGIGGAALRKGLDVSAKKLSGESKLVDVAEEEKTKNENAQTFVNKLNDIWKNPLNDIKSVLHNLALQNSFKATSEEAFGGNGLGPNLKGYHDIKDDADREFFMTLIRNGISDAWVDRVQEYSRTMSQDDLCKVMELDSTPENYENIKQQIAEIPGRVKDLKRISREVDGQLGNPFNPYIKDATTGERLYPDGTPEFNVEANNAHIHRVAKDYLVMIKDNIERGAVRTGDILNGKQGSSGIVDMPFVKNSGFADVYTALHLDELDKQIANYNEELKIKSDPGTIKKKEVTESYRNALNQFHEEYNEILNKGAYKDRQKDINALTALYHDELTKELHPYLEEGLTTRDITGKVISKKPVPTKSEVSDGIEKMMDYYKLSIETDRLHKILSTILDPSIIRKYQMSFMKEGFRRQAEATQEESTSTTTEPVTNEPVTTTTTPEEPKPVPVPTPQPVDTRAQDNIRSSIREWITEDKTLSPEANKYLNEDKTGLKQVLQAAEIIYTNDDNTKSKAQFLKEIDEILNKHFDKDVSPLDYSHLPDKPKVEGTGPYTVSGIVKKFDSIREANQALQEKYPKFEISGREFQVGQHLYDDNGKQYLLKDRDVLIPTTGKSPKPIQATGDTLLQYHDQKPDAKPGAVPIPETRLYKVDEVVDPYTPTFRIVNGQRVKYTPEEILGLKKKLSDILTSTPKDQLHDKLEIRITKNDVPADDSTYPYRIKGVDENGNPVYGEPNPYIVQNREQYTIGLYRRGDSETLQYFPNADKLMFHNFGDGQVYIGVPPKDKFELVFDLNGKPLDAVYSRYEDNVRKAQQLTEVASTGVDPNIAVSLFSTTGSQEWAPDDNRPTIQDHRKAGNTILAIIQHNVDKSVYGMSKIDIVNNGYPLPVGNYGGNYPVLIGKPNGGVTWTRLITPVYEPAELDGIVKEYVDNASSQIRELYSSGKLEEAKALAKLSTSKLETIFIPQPSDRVVVNIGFRTDPITGNVWIKPTYKLGTERLENGKPIMEYGLTKGLTELVVNAGVNENYEPLNKPLNFNGDSKAFMQRVEKELNNFLYPKTADKRKKSTVPEAVQGYIKNNPIKIDYNNIRKGYVKDENGKIPDELVNNSKTNVTTNVTINPRVTYTVNKSALYQDAVPDSANVPRGTDIENRRQSAIKRLVQNTDGTWASNVMLDKGNGKSEAAKVTDWFLDLKGTKEDAIQQINAKYDAELKALEQKPEPISPAKQLADIGYTPIQSEEAQIQNLIDTHGDDIAAIRKSVRDSAKKLIPSGVQLSAHDIVTIHKFDKWMADNLPDWIQRGELVPRLINGHVTAGEFVTATRTIYTSESAPFKYHEAFHSVYRTLLTAPQQRALLDEAERHAPVTTNEFEKFQDAYGHDKNRDDYYEEWVADKFDSWKADHKTDVPDGIRGWFQRLWNMLKELFKRLTGNQIEAMFYKMDRAGYKHAKLQDNEFTQTNTSNDSALKLIQIGTEEYIAPDGTKQSIPKYLSQEEGQRLSNTIAALYHMDSLTNTGSKRQLIEAILDNYRDTLDPVQPRYDEQFTQRYKADPVEAIRWDKKLNEQYNLFNKKESRESLIEAIDEHLKLMGYKQDINDAEVSRAENEVGAKNYDTNADEIGGYDALALPVREYIGSTVVPYTDEFGNSQMANGQPVYQAVDGARVYNGLTQLLKNIPDINDVVDKLVKAQYNGDTGAVIRRLISDTGFTIDDQNQWTISKNSQLFIQFLNGFRQASINHIFVEAGTEGGVVGSTTRAYEANRRSVDRNQTDQWAVSFDAMYQKGYDNAGSDESSDTTTEKKAYTQEHLKAWNTLREHILDKQGSYADDNAFVQKAQSISNDIKEELGISIHPLYIQYSIASTQEEPSEYMTELLSTYKATPIAVDDLEGIRTVLTKGNNPFTEAINRLRNIATGNAVFDDTVDSTNYTNAENKNIYSFQQFNYILEQGVKMNRDTEIERLKSNPDTEMCHFLTDYKWLKCDKRVSVVDGIALRYHEANDKGELDTPSYLETNQSEGSSMKHFNVRELEYYRFSIYQAAEKVNGIYGTNVIPAIISDKSRLYMVNVPVIASVYHNKENRLKISEGAMAKLYNIVQEETARIQRVQKEIDSWTTDEEKQFNHINDWHNGKLNGLKYNRAKQMLGDLLNPDGTVKEGANMKQFPVQNQIEKYFLNKGGAIDKYLSELVEEGVIVRSDIGYTNKLLPGYLWDGISGEKGDGLNLKSDFKHNIAQIYISNFINADGYTHLLSPNGITTKRLSFWNADGPGVAKPNIIAPELGIEKPFTDFHVAVLKEPKDENGFDHADSQGWITEEGMRKLHWGWGTLTQKKANILDKVATGQSVSNKEIFGRDGLVNSNDMLNPLKPVFYDGYTGIKLSVHMLTKEQVMIRSGNGRWVPDPARAELYKIWRTMKDHEEATGDMCMIVPKSASKLQTKNVAPSIEELNTGHFTKLDANYLRKQLENPSNKLTMTKPTQPVWQLAAEQDDSTQVYGTTIGEIRKQYGNDVAERLQQNWNNALNGLFEIAGNKPLELSSTADLDRITPTLGKFYDQMREQLQATGANEQTLGFLETRNGEPVYPALDFPATLEKYTQQVLNYFGRVMNEQVPGITATKVSPFGYNIIREIHEVDDNGTPVPGKWRVVPQSEYSKDLDKYRDAIPYTDKQARTHTGLKPGDIIIDHLRTNVPEYIDDKMTGIHYSEYLVPVHHAEDTGTIDSPVAKGYRNDIPYAAGNNGNAYLRVDTLPAYLGSIEVNPSKQSQAGGKDHDLDKDYLQTFDTYSDGEKLHKYGEATTDKDKFEEYVMYQASRNPQVKSLVKELEDTDEGLVQLLLSDNKAIVLNALKQLKLPSTVQEFMERGGENLNVGVLNNRELESKIALAGNSHVAGGESPINMETTSTKLLSDLISKKDGNSLYNIFERRLTEDANLTPESRKRIEDLLKSFEISDVNINEMNGQSYTASVIWTGKNSVGVAANGVPVLSFVTQHDIPVSSDYIRFGGVDYNNLSSTTTQNGTRKFDVMMTYINTMTDNAKLDGLAAKLGLTKEALSDAMSMNQAGMNIDDVILYMLQPAVRKYYNAITYIQGTLKSFEEERTFKNKILQDAIDSYQGQRKELNRTDLENNIVESDPTIELSALLDIQKASKTGESLFNLSNVLGLAGGLPASWEEVDGIKEALEKLGIVNGKLVQDYTGVIDMRHALMTDPITSRYIQMLTQMDKLSPLLFMERSELYKRAMEIYSANLRPLRKSEKVKVTKERKQELISYLTIANLIQELTGKGDIATLDSMDNALIYESLNGEHITDVVDRLKTTLTGKKSNYFISQFIRPQKATDISNKSRINKLDSNNWAKLSDQRQIQIRDSFMQLATNPTTRAHAMKLFNYLLVKDGGQFKSGSFIKYVAPAIFKDLLDSTAKVKRALALKQYSDIDALELFGKDWNSVMNDYVKASGTHIDNKQYLKYIRVPVLDTKSYKPEQLEQLGFTVSGKPGKEIIEFPYTYRNGDSIYQLQTVFKADGKLITDKEHETIAKGSRAIYVPAQTTGARNTYKAAGALFGPVPLTKDLIQKQPVPQTAIQLPYSPDSKVKPKEVTIQPQTDIAPVSSNQEAIKQLAQKHQIYVANEGGRNVARIQDGTVYPVPSGITPPQLLEQLNNPDTGHEIGEELDDDTIIELGRQRDERKRQQSVVPSQTDWKSTIDQIAKDKGLTADNKDKWLDKARDVYKALNGRVPDSEIIDQIKSCI